MKNTLLKQSIAVCMGLLLCVGGLGPLCASEPMVGLSHEFKPAVLRGIKVSPEDPFRFNFIVDGGKSGLDGDQLKTESSKLIRYFLASLTVPENDLWVNLSPDEKDRIIPNEFGTTEMGRDLLSQDYLLKQLSASLMYPEKDLGKEFWNKVHQQAQEKFGSSDIPVNTFNKVWIVPDRAVIYQNPGAAFIGETHLKVMMERDYVALAGSAESLSSAKGLTSQTFKEFLLPKIEKEVNEGENFAPLRQVYYSLILAAWYKRSLKQSILSQVYVDKNKVAGVDVADKNISEKIYEQYLKTFKDGVYNLIREEKDESTGEMVPRKYFSGGIFGAKIGEAITALSLQGNEASASSAVSGPLVQVEINVAGVPTKPERSLSKQPKAGPEWISTSVVKQIEQKLNRGRPLAFIDFEVARGNNYQRFQQALQSFAPDQYVAMMIRINDKDADGQVYHMVIDQKSVLLDQRNFGILMEVESSFYDFGQFTFFNSFWVFPGEKTVYSAMIDLRKEPQLQGTGAFALKTIAKSFREYFGSYYLLDLPIKPIIKTWLDTEFKRSDIESNVPMRSWVVMSTYDRLSNAPMDEAYFTFREIPETVKPSSASSSINREARKELFKLKVIPYVKEIKKFAIMGRFLLEITDARYHEMLQEILSGSDGLLNRVLVFKIPAKREAETLTLLKNEGAIDPDTEYFRSFTLTMEQARKGRPIYYIFIHEYDFKNPAALLADLSREYMGNIIMHELYGPMPTHYENEIRSYSNLVETFAKLLNESAESLRWVETELSQFGPDELGYLKEALSNGLALTEEFDDAYKEYERLSDLFEEAKAMSGNSSASSAVKGKDNVGGIDLNPNQLNLDIRGQSSPISLPPNFEQIENLNIQGLVPVIINISPLNSLPTTWGITQKPPSPADKISLN